MISATTRLVALLGHPVSASLSPRMQNAAFAARALDWAYVACDVEPDALPAAVAGLRALGFAGTNVTIPHKGAAAGLCDDLAYRPDGRPTALIEAARAAGCRVVVDGLEILVRQGVPSFELWTGIPAPADVMRAAVTRIV